MFQTQSFSAESNRHRTEAKRNTFQNRKKEAVFLDRTSTRTFRDVVVVGGLYYTSIPWRGENWGKCNRSIFIRRVLYYIHNFSPAVADCVMRFLCDNSNRCKMNSTYGSRSMGAILWKHSMNWPSLQNICGSCGWLFTFRIRNRIQRITAITARNAGDIFEIHWEMHRRFLLNKLNTKMHTWGTIFSFEMGMIFLGFHCSWNGFSMAITFLQGWINVILSHTLACNHRNRFHSRTTPDT